MRELECEAFRPIPPPDWVILPQILGELEQCHAD